MSNHITVCFYVFSSLILGMCNFPQKIHISMNKPMFVSFPYKEYRTNLEKYLYNTFPIKADEPPNRDMPTATLAGAPPGAFLNAGASANETPLIVGTKSMSISPKQTTRGDSFVSGVPLPVIAFVFPITKKSLEVKKEFTTCYLQK